MPRIPKKYMNTSFFHIMVQGINKEYIFNNKKDIQEYLEIMEKIKENVNLQILKYCVMSNHIHLLIYTNNTDELTKFMHKTNLLYAKYYNKKYNRVGYVFRDRFKTQPIMTEKHLYCCIDYIHNNPVKANICNHPSEYPYSSYNYNRFRPNELVDKDIRKYINLMKMKISNNEEFDLMEIDERKNFNVGGYHKIIDDYLNKNNINIYQLKGDKILLFKLITNLQKEYKVSYRELEKELGISREKIRKIVKNES